MKGSTTVRSPLWLMGPGRDLMLVIGLPLFILPILVAVDLDWTRSTTWLAVAAFFAVSHHAPSLIRAYGDAGLFARFKTRFLVAPPVLGVVVAGSLLFNPAGLLLVFSLWGIWHFALQTHGFARIYDDRVGNPGKGTSLLDKALCVSWFGGIALTSNTMLIHHLQLYLGSGGPAFSPSLFHGFRMVWYAATAALTVTFVVNAARSHARGQRQNPAKFLLLATSFGFYGYVNVVIPDVILGFALYELFHDVQVTVIVWLYNRRRVEKAPAEVGAFTRFVFRPGSGRIALYIGLLAAYACISLLRQAAPPGSAEAVQPNAWVGGLTLAFLSSGASDWWAFGLKSLVVTSALLHYYYEAFIWKIREPTHREPLGLASAGHERWLPRLGVGSVHVLLWAVFALPLVALDVAFSGGVASPSEQARSIAALLPDDATAHYNLGLTLSAEGRNAEAIQVYERVLALDVSHHRAHNNLGFIYRQSRDTEKSLHHLRRALALQPDYLLAQVNSAFTQMEAGHRQAVAGHLDISFDHYRSANRTLTELRDRGSAPGLAEGHRQAQAAMGRVGLSRAIALERRGRFEHAMQAWRELLDVLPGHLEAATRLGRLQLGRGESAKAVALFRAVVEQKPNDIQGRIDLANALSNLGRRDQAASVLRAGLSYDPTSALTHTALGQLAAHTGEMNDAVSHFRTASRLDPDNPEVHNNLGSVLAETGRLEAALDELQRAAQLAPDNPGMLYNLALAQKGAGQTTAAAATLKHALEVQPGFAPAQQLLESLPAEPAVDPVPK